MVDTCSYILIIASVAIFGYSLSQLIDSFGNLQKKVTDYRVMLAEIEEPLDGTRWVNSLQNLFLLVGYGTVAYLAGFFVWVLVLIAAKFSLSCVLSDRLCCLILNEKKSISKSFYWAHKADALLNAVFCVFILLVFVL